MRRIAVLLVALAALAGVVASMVRASGQAADPLAFAKAVIEVDRY